jgi:two-component sensor histidine kinase
MASLAEGLRSIELASTRSAILRALSQVAQKINNCAAVGLQSRDRDDLDVLLAGEDSPQRARSMFPHNEFAGSEPGRASVFTEPVSKDLTFVGSARKMLVRTMAVINVSPVAECVGICFFWTEPVTIGGAALYPFEILAAAGSLALQAHHTAEQHRRGHQQLRRQHAELQHRFRNVLSFVRSIVRRTMQSAESPEEFASHLEARISALSRTYSTLNVSGGHGVEIEDLVRTELRANAVRDDQFEVGGPPVRLRARAAETMALALHELATNSLKFGSLSLSSGRTKITWQADRSQSTARLKFQWLESGVRMAALAPRHRGFGQELIENTLPYELAAQTRFELTPGGLQCTVELPLTARTATVHLDSSTSSLPDVYE